MIEADLDPIPASSLLGPSGGWRARRDRLLSSPRFQRWATAFPLTRWIARRHARALFDLCAGFVYSQVLLACVRLRVFDHLAEGPLPLKVLVTRLDLPEDATRTLLEAARSLRLLERRRGGYGLGLLGAALRGNPGVAAMIEHHPLLYADLADPVALLRGDPTSRALAAYWPYAGHQAAPELGRPVTAAYTALMSISQAMIAAEILDAYPIDRHRCLLDVGGGDGTFLAAAAARAPKLRLILFDLPAVAGQAEARLARAGLTHRATTCGGDFTSDSLPRDADVATLVRVLHDHDDGKALQILKALRHCLGVDGTLLVAEPMADTPGADPIGHAYFGFYLKAMGSGRPRSAQEIAGLLRAAGFTKVTIVGTRSPMLTSLIVAR